MKVDNLPIFRVADGFCHVNIYISWAPRIPWPKSGHLGFHECIPRYLIVQNSIYTLVIPLFKAWLLELNR
jgi:hypothetical protein